MPNTARTPLATTSGVLSEPSLTRRHWTPLFGYVVAMLGSTTGAPSRMSTVVMGAFLNPFQAA
jgi:hypothetical protein